MHSEPDDHIPNKTIPELAEVLRRRGYPVSNREMHFAQWDEQNPLIPTKLGNRNYFSVEDGINWVAGQKGRYRAGTKVAGRAGELIAEKRAKIAENEARLVRMSIDTELEKHAREADQESA